MSTFHQWTKRAAAVFVSGLTVAAASQSVALFDTGTKAAAELRELNDRLGSFAPHPVVIMDRDWFHMNSAVQNLDLAEGESYKEKSELARGYFREKLGRDLIPALAWMFYKEIHSSVEQALPHGYEGSKFYLGGDESGNYCVLYPGRRDLDNERLTKYMIDYSRSSYGSLYGAEVKPVLSFEEHVRLTDYHEFSHCLDDKYMMAYMKGQIPEGQGFFDNRARIELKAEILGILLMVKFEGATDLALRRSRERFLDSWFRGRTLIRNASDPMNAQAGATYAFGLALESLQREIDLRGVDTVKNSAVPELISLADELVEKTVMTPEQRRFLAEALLDPQKASESASGGPFVNAYIGKVAVALSILTGGKLSPEKIRRTVLSERPEGSGEQLGFPELEVAGEERAKAVAELSARIGELRSGPSVEDSVSAYARLMDLLSERIRTGSERERLKALQEARLLPEALKRLLHGTDPRGR